MLLQLYLVPQSFRGRQFLSLGVQIQLAVGWGTSILAPVLILLALRNANAAFAIFLVDGLGGLFFCLIALALSVVSRHLRPPAPAAQIESRRRRE